jgi:N6-adenosine-specific RNA methylase IME4
MPKYKTVVIDPPWNIRNDKPLQLPHSPFPCLPYSTMNIEEIQAFPINHFADDECLLFLWVITSTIRDGFDILQDWGFRFHHILTWDKGSGHAIWSPIMGRTEHCLLGYRGNFRELTNNKMGVMQSLIKTTGVRKHSEKPARFYQLLRAWTPEPRIDIFARNHHEGFDGWGDEYVGEGPLAEWLE